MAIIEIAVIGSVDVLAKRHGRAAKRPQSGFDPQRRAKPGRAAIVDVQPAHDKHHAIIPTIFGAGRNMLFLTDVDAAKIGRAGALGKGKVIGMIYDAAGVGILKLDAQQIMMRAAFNLAVEKVPCGGPVSRHRQARYRTACPAAAPRFPAA